MSGHSFSMSLLVSHAVCLVGLGFVGVVVDRDRIFLAELVLGLT